MNYIIAALVSTRAENKYLLMMASIKIAGRLCGGLVLMKRLAVLPPELQT